MTRETQVWVLRSSLVASCLITAASLYWLLDVIRFQVNGRAIDADVVRIERGGGKSGKSYRPVYAFKDESGREWSGVSKISHSSFAEMKPADKLAIVYDPQNPQTSTLRGGMTWWAPAQFTLMGVIFMVVVISRMKASSD